MRKNNQPDIFVGQTVLLKFSVIDQEGFPVDISTANSHNITMKRIGGSPTSVVATLTNDGTDGLLEYETETADLNAEGVWEFQVLIVVGIHEYPATVKTLTVLPRVQ